MTEEQIKELIVKIKDDIFRIEIPLDDNYTATMNLQQINDLNNGKNNSVTEIEQKILNLINENPNITIPKIAESLNVSSSDILQ